MCEFTALKDNAAERHSMKEILTVVHVGLAR
jgi:hypothetical protein